MNQSESAMDMKMHINMKYLLTILFVLLELIGMIGNVLVIISVRVDSRMKRSLTNRLIVHVACCDLLILLFNIPDLIQFVSSINGNWMLNQLSCKLIRSILVLAQYASVLTMCAVTIERFIGIVYPLRSRFLREEKHVREITLFVWLFSLICASPNFVYLHVRLISSTRRVCLLEYSEDLNEHQRIYIIYKSIESTIFYFIPLLIQLYCYIRIASQLFHIDQRLYHSTNLRNKSGIQRDEIDDEDDDDEQITGRLTINESPLNSTTNGFNWNFPLTKNSPMKRSIRSNTLKSRRNVIKMLVVVVLIYFISFSPQVLVFLLFDTNFIRSIPYFIQTHYFIAFTMLLVTISSATNPIVYVIFSSKFRQSFNQILRSIFCCTKPNFIPQTNQTFSIPIRHKNEQKISSKIRS